MQGRILIVDDEPSVHEILRAYLERDGFTVYSALSGREGLELTTLMQPELLILDRVLPDLRGEEICADVRRRSDVPILILSGIGEAEDRVAGFALGADDYLVKPFSPRELVARVRALMRRSQGGQAPLGGVRTFDGGLLRVDTLRHEVSVRGTPLELTPSEYKLLLALASFPGRAYSRLELINRMQDHDFAGYERTVDAHVKNLRRKIEVDPARPRYIETVRGVGYRLGGSSP